MWHPKCSNRDLVSLPQPSPAGCYLASQHLRAVLTTHWWECLGPKCCLWGWTTWWCCRSPQGSTGETHQSSTREGAGMVRGSPLCLSWGLSPAQANFTTQCQKTGGHLLGEIWVSLAPKTLGYLRASHLCTHALPICKHDTAISSPSESIQSFLISWNPCHQLRYFKQVLSWGLVCTHVNGDNSKHFTGQRWLLLSLVNAFSTILPEWLTLNRSVFYHFTFYLKTWEKDGGSIEVVYEDWPTKYRIGCMLQKHIVYIYLW